MRHRYIILFDGVCNICNFWIKFVHKYDTKKLFAFQPIQSKKGIEILDDYDHFNPPRGLTSIVLIDEEEQELYAYSDAVAIICRNLAFPWPAVYYIRLCVPKIVADFLYVQFAKRRYQLFGKNSNKACAYIPGIKNRFIDWESPLEEDDK